MPVFTQSEKNGQSHLVAVQSSKFQKGFKLPVVVKTVSAFKSRAWCSTGQHSNVSFHIGNYTKNVSKMSELEHF